MPDAAWWREYRKANQKHLRAYNRERRRLPWVKSQRHAQEARRRLARRAELPCEEQPIGPPWGNGLFDEAARLIGRPPKAGNTLRWASEADWEDLVHEAILAALEGRDPAEAARRERARQGDWLRRTCVLNEALLEGKDDEW